MKLNEIFGPQVVAYDIETFFNKRRFHRASSRHVKPNYRPSHAGSRNTTNNSSKQEEVDIPPKAMIIASSMVLEMYTLADIKFTVRSVRD